jgi:hypothetical protein
MHTTNVVPVTASIDIDERSEPSWDRIAGSEPETLELKLMAAVVGVWVAGIAVMARDCVRAMENGQTV